MDRWAGQIERIVLLALWCYWTAISRCNTSPCWSLCFDKQKKPTKSLSLFDFSHRFDMLSMCKQRYCFLDSAVSNAIRMLGCCLSALPVVHISLLIFLTKGTQKGWVNAQFAYLWLQTVREPKNLSCSLSPLLFSVCLTSPLRHPSAVFLQTWRL